MTDPTPADGYPYVEIYTDHRQSGVRTRLGNVTPALVWAVDEHNTSDAPPPLAYMDGDQYRLLLTDLEAGNYGDQKYFNKAVAAIKNGETFRVKGVYRV